MTKEKETTKIDLWDLIHKIEIIDVKLETELIKQ